MATFPKKMSGDTRYYIELEVNEVAGSVNVDNNTSNVRYVLTATKNYKGGGYHSESAVNTVKVTLGGEEIVNKKVTYNFQSSSEKTITLASGTETIQHNADGTKSLSCKGYFKDGANSLGSATASGSLQLTNIPRASSFNINVGSITLGSPVNITITRASENYTHTLLYSYGNITNEVIATNVEDSYNWTPPIELAQQIPNTTSANMKIECKTYNNGSLIGSSTLFIQAGVPNNLYPSASISNPITGGDTPTSWGVFVKGKSTATYTITGTGNQGSSIVGYQSSVDGYTYTTDNVTTNTLMTTGTNTIIAIVTDSRGKQATTQRNFNVLDYSNPTITTAQVQRCDIDGNLDNNGDYCFISYEGSITSLGGNNTGYAAFLIKYKLHEEEEYTLAVPLGAFVNSYSGTGMLYTDGIYPANRGSGTKLQLPTTNTYDIQFVANDYFNTTTNVQVLDTGFDLMNFNPSGKSMAIGKVSEADENEEILEVALDTEFTGEVNGGTINFTASNYHDVTKQDKLTAGTNITIDANNVISATGGGGGGTATTVKINGTSITSNNEADIKTNGTYNASSNKIATMSDIPTIPFIPTKTSDLINDGENGSLKYLEKKETNSPLWHIGTTNDSHLYYESGISYLDTTLANLGDLPTKVSDLTNDSGFITKSVNNLDNYTKTSSLATVATSGNYNDLTNKPTIPTVNNATLTIQQNGTTLDTFTANSSTNKTVNIVADTFTHEIVYLDEWD